MRSLRSRTRTHCQTASTPPPAHHRFPLRSASSSSNSFPLFRLLNLSPFLSPSTRSDHVLRDITILSILAALALTFLNLFLYSAILAVGLLVPAWQTVKALEGRHQPHIELIELDSDNDVEDDDENDDDWLPPGGLAPPRTTPTPTTQPAPRVTTTHHGHAHRSLQNWQAYWIMAAILFAFDGFLSPWFCKIVPQTLYAACLFSAVAWLTRNHGGNAAAVYMTVVRPMFLKSEHVVDKVVDKIVREVDVVSREAVIRVNRAIEPCARQLEHAAEAATREMKEMAEERLGHGRRRRDMLR